MVHIHLHTMEVKESTDLKGFKSLLKTWEGTNCQCTMCDVIN